MKLLVVGSGGREHALVWKLAASNRVTHLWCAPGNGGIAGERLKSNGGSVECVPIAATDIEGLLRFARTYQPDLTVIGPDDPLAIGIVDAFEREKFRIWGPNRNAARFESSKAFAQEFMERHGIPTAKAGIFTEPDQALKFVKELDGRCAVKADGLALGKGVLICRTHSEAESAIQQVMIDKAFGSAGKTVVIQELLEGDEVSLHALCDGERYCLFPTSQDHKRALDGDQGLNTGGMGAYSPTPFLSKDELDRIRATILDPWLRGCKAEGIGYRGMLYPGLMLTDDGPKVLEFNARFGDPETQVYLMRLESDLLELIEASIDGHLDQSIPIWRSEAAVCVVMASGGYPLQYAKGNSITGIRESESDPDVKVFHAGTRLEGDTLSTSGGRVLGVTAIGANIAEAAKAAYGAVSRITFNNAHYRGDIAANALHSS